MRQMDKDLLDHGIFSDSGVEVGLSRKIIYLGKKGSMEEKEKVKSLHVEINTIHNQWNFTTLSNKYGILDTAPPGGRNIWLLPVKTRQKVTTVTKN